MLGLKPTQIRVTNTSNADVEINLQKPINGELLDDGVSYDFEGALDPRECNKLKEYYFIRLSSGNVLKSIKRFIEPEIDLEELRVKTGKFKDGRMVDVEMSGSIQDMKFTLAKKNHIVITFFHK